MVYPLHPMPKFKLRTFAVQGLFEQQSKVESAVATGLWSSKI